MGRIPRHLIDEVRERTDIVAVVQRHVAVVRRGSGYVGLCPFHQEKTPSFHVVPQKHLYHCFGCQAGGDVFRFLMQIEGLSFIEAVKELAGPAGVTIEDRELTPEERRQLRRRATSYDVLDEAAKFFENALWTRSESASARAYLERRGLTPETIRAARLGYAPPGWSTLLDHMHRQGFSQALLLEVGLVRERSSGGGAYDFLRDRITFPIRDERGRVLAFGARLMEGEGPKYLNTPESPIYQKSRVLYGLDVARQAIQKRKRAVVVEGYMDVLSLHQAGFEEAIATCGTALTPDHLDKLRRLTRDVIALFDGDEAGARAAERSLPLFLEAGVQSWRLELPDAKDPDDLIREQGAEALERAIAQKEPLLEWLVQRRLTAAGGHAGSQAQVVEDLLPLLAELPRAVVSNVAARLRVNEQALLERLAKVSRRPADAPPPSDSPTGWRPSREMVHLLWLLVHRYDQVADLLSRVDPTLFDDQEEVRGVMARLVAGEPVAGILPEITDPGVTRTLSAVVARGHLYEPDQAAAGMCDVLDGLARRRRERFLAHLTTALEQAQRTGEGAREILSRRAALITMRKELRAALTSGDIAAYLDALTREAALCR